MVYVRLALVAVCLVFAASASARDMVVRATWYCKPYEGRKMASGQRYDCNAATIAVNPKKLPLPLHKRVRLTNMANGKSVDARVMDHSPYSALDVSQAIAEQLDFKQRGIATLRVALISN